MGEMTIIQNFDLGFWTFYIAFWLGHTRVNEHFQTSHVYKLATVEPLSNGDGLEAAADLSPLNGDPICPSIR